MNVKKDVDSKAIMMKFLIMRRLVIGIKKYLIEGTNILLK